MTVNVRFIFPKSIGKIAETQAKRFCQFFGVETGIRNIVGKSEVNLRLCDKSSAVIEVAFETTSPSERALLTSQTSNIMKLVEIFFPNGTVIALI